MQEEVENRSVNLVVSTGKLSIRILLTALRKYLDSRSNKRKIRAQTIRSEKRQVKMAGRLERERDRVRKELEGPRGKQTVKQLMQSGKDVHQIPVNHKIIDGGIRTLVIADGSLEHQPVFDPELSLDGFDQRIFRVGRIDFRQIAQRSQIDSD